MVTDAQVKVLRQKRMEGKTMETAAAAAGMGVRTAQKWQTGALPSAARRPRACRTRPDPFAGVWDTEVVPLLEADSKGALQAVTLLEVLEQKHPGGFPDPAPRLIRGSRNPAPRAIRRRTNSALTGGGKLCDDHTPPPSSRRSLKSKMPEPGCARGPELAVSTDGRRGVAPAVHQSAWFRRRTRSLTLVKPEPTR